MYSGVHRVKTRSSVVVVTIGLYCCFLVSTVFQERLYSFKGVDGSKFEAAPLLTLVKSVTNVAVSRTVIHFRNNGRGIKPSGTSAFVVALIRCSGAMLSLYSLKFVSYPYLVLGRSVKIVPVLVSEFIYDGRCPSLRRCFAVLVTTAGMLVFSLPKLVNNGPDTEPVGGLGILLIAMSLLADGGLSMTQKRMVKDQESKPAVFETMFYMSSWQAFFSFVVVLLSGGENGGVSFCLQNPGVVRLLLWPSVIESVGQFFIFELVIHHGPFLTAMVTTLRKFVTIVISVFLFGHVLTAYQWLALIMVFAGVTLETVVIMLAR